ncbi:hypothetical protein ANOM_011667 [Aspergillus nomiae NRRL 13137]|uniref:Uncharacterized protein n=1 Tax=Aspergillus nomiae NRRL (strain ATCC 15546 / NRRL 13137 / CBS 260.88 / M93) TaxID=1509407 RepID=A0A0L1ILH1_ASPN3|nr:uncharacterized protein ANOM_011667 [Aspergillus nomiae NRRL 13137]KNG80110.1 hypothetical protein ANOM_011667 [Aspergillus nomiae NRRL 13137]
MCSGSTPPDQSSQDRTSPWRTPSFIDRSPQRNDREQHARNHVEAKPNSRPHAGRASAAILPLPGHRGRLSSLLLGTGGSESQHGKDGRGTHPGANETNPPQPQRRPHRGWFESPGRGEGEHLPGRHGGFCGSERSLRDVFPGSQAGADVCGCQDVAVGNGC